MQLLEQRKGDIMSTNNTKTNGGGLKSLYLKEDWWAVWIGLGIVVVALILWATGQSGVLGDLNGKFAGYSDFSGRLPCVTGIFPNAILLYVVLAVIFSIVMGIMGKNVPKFLGGFTLLYVMAILVQILSAWSLAKQFSLEAPVMALIVGIIIGNFVKIPDWFEAGMRTEFYVKTGIVLMGATLPFTLILQSGPVALMQATIIAVSTFLVIYFCASRLFKLEKPFAATLATGGSFCGGCAPPPPRPPLDAPKGGRPGALPLGVFLGAVRGVPLPRLRPAPPDPAARSPPFTARPSPPVPAPPAR